MKCKKLILFIFIVCIIIIFNFKTTNVMAATSSSVKKAAVTKVVSTKKTTVKKKIATKKSVKTGKTVMTMKWSADGLKTIGNIASFDYSYAIRNAVIKKIENYAKRNHITVITAKVINSMNE